MSTTTRKPIRTSCSGCMTDLTVDTDLGVVLAKVPSNGIRGARHVPAHNVSAEIYGDEDLLMWDCPIPTCGYADSFDVHHGESS